MRKSTCGKRLTPPKGGKHVLCCAILGSIMETALQQLGGNAVEVQLRRARGQREILSLSLVRGENTPKLFAECKSNHSCAVQLPIAMLSDGM